MPLNERIVLDVDEKGVATSVASANRSVASLEASFARAGQTVEQRLLAKIATLQGRMANDPMRLKELDALQQRVLSKVAENTEKAGSKFQQLGAKVKEAIENPLHAAGSAAESLLTKLGPVGVAASAMFAMLIGVAKNGFEAMKSLGSFGVEVEHTGLRMGLSAKEVAQFRFAAQYAGGEIGVFEGAMRKLSQEVEGGGVNLSKYGVKFRDLHTGALLPTKDVLIDLSERLNAMPNAWERNAAAVKVLGRAGLEILPELLELPEGLKRAEELQKNYTPAQLARWKEYQHQVAEIESAWESLKRSMKEPLAAVGSFVVKAAQASKQDVKPLIQGAVESSYQPYGFAFMNSGRSRYAPSPTKEMLDYGKPDAEKIARNNALIDSVLGSNIEEKLSIAKDKLKDLRDELGKMRGQSYPEATAQQRAQVLSQQAVVDGIEKQVAAQKRLNAQHGELFKTEALIDKIREKRAKEATEKGFANAPDMDEWRKEEMAQAKAFLATLDYQDRARRGNLERGYERTFAANSAQSGHDIRMAELGAGPGNEVGAIQQAYQMRVASLAMEQQIKEESVRGMEGVFDIEQDRWKLQQEMQAAGYEYEEKLAQLQKSRFDELRASMSSMIDAAFAGGRGFLDTLKRTSEALFLSPIKQAASAAMARAMMPAMYGADGSGGIMGRISGLFGGGGLSNVKLIGGAVPVYVTGGGGSSAAGGAVLGGLLASGGAVARTAGEVIGAGDSTEGLTRLSSGLWQRGPAAAADIFNLPMNRSLSQVAQLVGGPGGTSGFTGPVQMSGGSGGVAGAAQSAGMFGGFKSSLTSLGNLGSKFSTAHGGVNGAAGGAMMAGGGILLADGLRRGGGWGVAESAGGGALIGAKFGGPIGAVVGGIAGAVAGLVRLGIKSAAEKVMEKVKMLYGLSIDRKMAQQIVDLANQKYSKNLDMAVRAPETRDLLRLYAQTMGQKVSQALMADTPRAASLLESRGGLYQQAQYDNGQAYSYASSLPSYGGVQTSAMPTGSPYGAGQVNVYLNPQQTVDLWKTGTTAAIQGNPRSVAASAYRGNQQGASRFGVAQMAFAPGAISQ